jgi:hypothetical protein
MLWSLQRWDFGDSPNIYLRPTIIDMPSYGTSLTPSQAPHFPRVKD